MSVSACLECVLDKNVSFSMTGIYGVVEIVSFSMSVMCCRQQIQFQHVSGRKSQFRHECNVSWSKK